ncbi:MAG: hypothetical protein N4J56_002979 [Chroococcidiopsis sp. SAG 2025]|uniref:DUF1565 domain-containing protein n=1 Tax=Chroococcidiopsis sp. SAG 2025 TaxID=171389 RepID=UPI0029372209|nr:DUF1565 domain-containing protein [Chroococcidiopsis sp. SAG 2025]MDV2993325.1 hypothetical protein [Chroococcidiopsis sp. SAG 2025]
MKSFRSDRHLYLSFQTMAQKTCIHGLFLSATRISLTIFFWLCFSHVGIAIPPLQLTQTPTSESQTAKKVIFVNPTAVENGNGSESSPFKTIAQALQQAESNVIIKLAAGTYSRESGETFPLRLKPGVTLQGDSSNQGSNIVIKGGGMYMSPTFARQDVAILGADEAGLTGITVTNPNPRGYGLWIESCSPAIADNTFTGSSHDGISITGDSAPIVRNNRFIQNGANGITVYGISKPEIRANVFEQTGYGINVAQRAAPLIIENQIINNRAGVVSQAFTKPVLRNNIIEGNKEDGVVAIGNSQPDLGTPTEPGKNQFRQNGRYDINSSAAKRITISAVGNQVTADRSIGNIDFAGTSNVASNSGGVENRRGGLSESATDEAINLGSKPARTGVVGAGLPEDPVRKPTIPSNPPARESLIPNSEFRIPNSPPASQPALQVVEIPVPPPESESAPVQKKPAQKPKKPSASKPSKLASHNQSPKVATSTTKPKPEVVKAPATKPKPEATKAPATNEKQPLAANPQTEVEIPVSRSQPPAKGDTITHGLPTLKPAAVNPNELLPVPDGDIPSSSDRPARIAAVSSHNSSQVGSLRYRVLVEAENAPTQEKVRSLVPGSFRVSAKGKTIMQAGAFSDRSKADEVAQLLTSNGLKAKVEQMN